MPHKPILLKPSELPGTPALGLIQRLEKQLTGLEAARDKTTADVEHAQREIQRAEDQLAKPFPHTQGLADARRRVAELDVQLSGLADDGQSADVPGVVNEDDSDRPSQLADPLPVVFRFGPDDTSAPRPHTSDDPDVAERQTQHRPGGLPTTSRADPPSDDRARGDASGGEQVGRAAESAEASLTPAHLDGYALRVVHNQHGTTVFGTQRDDLAVRSALKDAGFKWSGHQKVWFLPRRWLMSTRTTRVQQLVAILARTGRPVPVLNSEPAATGPAIEAVEPPVESAVRPSSSTRRIHELVQ